MGVILCIFYSDGILAVLIDILKRCCNEIHRGVEHNLRSQEPIPSIPVAFEGLRSNREEKVSCMVISI